MTMLTVPLHHIIPTLAKISIQFYLVFSLDCTQIQQEFKLICKGRTSLSQTNMCGRFPSWSVAAGSLSNANWNIWVPDMVTCLFCTAELSTEYAVKLFILIWEGNPIDAEISHYFKEECNLSCDYSCFVFSTILHASVCIGQFIWGQFFYTCISVTATLE